ncbi:MAG: PHP domain-containing protein [bacterium]
MKIDLHTHSCYSYDGLSSPREMLLVAREKGLAGIALTDHDTTKGWDEALVAAEELKMLIVLGEEIKTERGDILGLFLKEEIKSRRAEEVIKEIRAQGGLVVIPHSFHFFERFCGLEMYKELLDGIEVFNARLPFYRADESALVFAQKNNLAMTAGSDAHYCSGVGYAYTTVKTAENLEEFKAGILEKRSLAEGQKSPLFHLIFPLLGKIKSFINSA